MHFSEKTDEGTLVVYQSGEQLVTLMTMTGDQGDFWHYWENTTSCGSSFEVQWLVNIGGLGSEKVCWSRAMTILLRHLFSYAKWFSVILALLIWSLASKVLLISVRAHFCVMLQIKIKKDDNDILNDSRKCFVCLKPKANGLKLWNIYILTMKIMYIMQRTYYKI